MNRIYGVFPIQIVFSLSFPPAKQKSPHYGGSFVARPGVPDAPLRVNRDKLLPLLNKKAPTMVGALLPDQGFPMLHCVSIGINFSPC